MSGALIAHRTRPHPHGWLPVGGVVALLVVSNVMTNEVLPGWAYLPWNLAAAVLLLAVAVRLDGTPPPLLGWQRSTWRRGVVVGGVVAAGVAVVYVAGVALPATRGLFDDDRVGDVSVWGMAYQVLIRIPFGTVVMEEVAFRGVLLGMLLARTTVPVAVGASSVLFGLWHVLPSIGIETTNPVFEDTLEGDGAPVLAVVLAVVGTTVAGLWLAALRLVGRNLLAPVMAHVATNSLGFFLAWMVIRSG